MALTWLEVPFVSVIVISYNGDNTSISHIILLGFHTGTSGIGLVHGGRRAGNWQLVLKLEQAFTVLKLVSMTLRYALLYWDSIWCLQCDICGPSEF